jgi:DUF1365 family protein
MSARSALYVGRVMHQRLRPLRHRLDYRVFMLLVDLDEMADLQQRLRLFSLNRLNLFSLHERDHGGGLDPGGLRPYVEQQLNAAGLQAGGAIQLLCMPRILGHVFNPLSVYFCHQPDGALQAVLYEVTNTFGERHSYLIPVPAGDGYAEHLTQQCDKRFFVSPFLSLDMHYRFQVEPPHPGRTDLRVGINACDADGTVLQAQLQTQRRPLSDAALLRVFFSHPLLTLKVVLAIHLEALVLWFKGLRLHRRPAPPAVPVSHTKSNHS